MLLRILTSCWMILPEKTKFYVVCGYVDLKWGDAGSAGIVQQLPQLDLFTNTRLLFCSWCWEDQSATLKEVGFLLLYKRQEFSSFQLSCSEEQAWLLTRSSIPIGSSIVAGLTCPCQRRIQNCFLLFQTLVIEKNIFMLLLLRQEKYSLTLCLPPWEKAL